MFSAIEVLIGIIRRRRIFLPIQAAVLCLYEVLSRCRRVALRCCRPPKSRTIVEQAVPHGYAQPRASMYVVLLENPENPRKKLVLLERFELSASPLPRECSTPEL